MRPITWLLLTSSLATVVHAQVTVSPGSPTQNPSTLLIQWPQQHVSELKLVIGRNTSTPCVIGLHQVPTVNMFNSLSDWYPSSSGSIGSGTLSGAACTVNLAASSLSTSNSSATIYSASLNIQVSGVLTQAGMDVTYLHRTYADGGVDEYQRTDAIGTWNVTNAPAQPALLTSPAPGFIQPNPNAIFNWSAANFPATYQVFLGSAQGATDIEHSGTLTGTSWAFSPLPMGTTIHITLVTLPNGGGAPHYRYYTVLTMSPAAAAQITSPVPGSTLSNTGVTFQWSAAQGATLYKIEAGTRAGTADLLDRLTSNLSASTSIPLNGQSIYVTLTAYPINTSRSFVYRTTSAPSPPVPGALVSPAPSSNLPAGSVLFSWSAGSGVQSYRLTVGSAPEGANIFDSQEISGTSISVSTIPQTGITLYATLWSRIGNTLTKNSYSYTAPYSQPPSFSSVVPGGLISPVPGTQLSGPTATFQWSSGFGVSNYQFCAGSSQGSCNLYLGQVSPINAQTTFALQQDGSVVHVSLWSQIGGYWSSSNATVSAVPQPCSQGCYQEFGPALQFNTLSASVEHFQFRDGLSIVPPSIVSPNLPTSLTWQWLTHPFGFYPDSSPVLPKHLIIPRGRRYINPDWYTPGGSLDMALSQVGDGYSAFAGGAECFTKPFNALSSPLDSQSQVCGVDSGNPANPVVPSGGVALVREPFMALRTVQNSANPSDPPGSRQMGGFNVRAAFLELTTTPLRTLGKEVAEDGVLRDIPSGFDAYQSIYFHHDRHYYGGGEYGYYRSARTGQLLAYLSVETNLPGRLAALVVDDLFGRTGLSVQLNDATRAFDYAAWVVHTGIEPMICFQIGVRKGSNPSPVAFTTKACKRQSEIPNMLGNMTSADAQQAFVDFAKPGYITATNWHGSSQIGADIAVSGSPTTRMPKSIHKKYYSTQYTIPDDHQLVVWEFQWTPPIAYVAQ